MRVGRSSGGVLRRRGLFPESVRQEVVISKMTRGKKSNQVGTNLDLLFACNELLSLLVVVVDV